MASGISSANTSATGFGEDSSSVIQRSWRAVAQIMAPSSASASLPNGIGATNDENETQNGVIQNGQESTANQIRDYHSINAIPPKVNIPKKVSTPVRVEGKVWLANERTWNAWANISLLVGALALALFNASDDYIAKYFAYSYAIISAGVLIYGYTTYQHRITMIRNRYPGSFDNVTGPVVVSVLLFLAVLANFILRVREWKRNDVYIPGQSLFYFFHGSK